MRKRDAEQVGADEDYKRMAYEQFTRLGKKAYPVLCLSLIHIWICYAFVIAWLHCFHIWVCQYLYFETASCHAFFLGWQMCIRDRNITTQDNGRAVPC